MLWIILNIIIRMNLKDQQDISKIRWVRFQFCYLETNLIFFHDLIFCIISTLKQPQGKPHWYFSARTANWLRLSNCENNSNKENVDKAVNLTIPTVWAVGKVSMPKTHVWGGSCLWPGRLPLVENDSFIVSCRWVRSSEKQS